MPTIVLCRTVSRCHQRAALRPVLAGHRRTGSRSFRSPALWHARFLVARAGRGAAFHSAGRRLIGGAAGYLGGRWERLVTAVVDLFLSLPWLFLLLAVRALLPLNTSPVTSVMITFLLLGCLGWAAPARIIRAGARTLVNSDYLVQASASGISRWRLFWRHLLPNLQPILLAQFWISVPLFILSEANLGLLGLGVSEPLPSWGAMLRELENYSAILQNPWMLAPAVSTRSGGQCVCSSCFEPRKAPHVDPSRDRIVVGRCALASGAANELRFCLRTDPKTFDPLLVEDESSSTVRYLTGGVLIRLNRYTQELEGELATKWRVSDNGRRIDFDLRRGVRFSDGTPFTCDDVAYTMHQLMDPALHSPVGDAFRSAPGEVETKLCLAVLCQSALSGPRGRCGRAIRWSSCPVRALTEERIRGLRSL